MKTIDSTIKGFTGKVHFCDPLNYGQVIAIEDAKDAAAEDLPASAFLTKLNEIQEKNDEQGAPIRASWNSRYNHLFIPAICKCVEKWEIEGFPEEVTPDNFPMSPRNESNQLVSFLFAELEKIYIGEIDIPNE